MQRLTRRRALQAGVGTLGALAGCLGSGAVDSGGPGTDSGQTATESGLALETLDVQGSPGETVPLQPAGEVVLLDFFATWCAPCKPQMEHLGTIREQFPQLHMVSVTWENDRDAVADFWKEYDGAWAVAMDPQVKTGEAYGVERLPTKLIFDAESTEVWRHVGLSAADSIAEKLREAGATEA